MRQPLVAPLAAVAGGILVSRLSGLAPGEAGLAAAALAALGWLGWWRRSRRLAAVCCLLGSFFAGALAEAANRRGPPPELEEEGELLLGGCVVEPPAVSGARERFELELEPGARVQVTLYGEEGAKLPELRYGQRIELEARVRRPRNFRNPGAFDYARYLARRQIYWTASARADRPIARLPGACGSSFYRAIAELRTAALERIAGLYAGRTYETGMMQAILIGESFQLERVWVEHFRSTGTFHALVISGSHVAVLAGFFLLLLRLCFVPAGWAMLLTTLASWLYALVTGWQAPVIRAAAALTLYLAGRYLYRERRLLNLLAAVALAFLLFDPEQMFEPSFQLSFLAVGFFGVFALPLIDRSSGPLGRHVWNLRDTGRDLNLAPKVAQFRVELRLLAETVALATRLPLGWCQRAAALAARAAFALWELFLVSAIIQIGLALPLVVYFHRVGFTGLSANAFIVPLMGVVVPAGFVAVFTGWQWAAEVAGLLLGVSRAVVEWHARLEPAWRVPTPPLWLAVALAAALIGAALGRWWWRAAAATLLVLVVWHPFPPRVEKGRLELTAIDVGQGESLLVAFPDGRLLVMDGGGIPTYGGRRPALDIGEDVVSPYLWRRSIRRLDALALTHGHEDHMGGLAALLDNFRPRELWLGAGPQTRVEQLAAARGVRVLRRRAGERFAYGGAQVEVLSPPSGLEPGDKPRDNDSLVLRLRYGRHTFLTTGDIDGRLEANLDGRADVLKVAHHGSRNSTGEEFLQAVRPAFAIISAGQGNLYGHPHPQVIDRLTSVGAMVLRTDRDGLVTLASDGRRLYAQTAREARLGGGLYRAF